MPEEKESHRAELDAQLCAHGSIAQPVLQEKRYSGPQQQSAV